MTMIDKTYPIAEKLLASAVQLAEQLHQQLDQEADALLQEHSADLINEIAANKKQLVLQLEQFSKQLAQVLATEQLPDNQDGILSYLQRAEASGLLTADFRNNWTRLQTTAAACKTLNEQNGAGIDLLARHNQRSLQILKGKPQLSHTYGRNGLSQNELYSHSLVSV